MPRLTLLAAATAVAFTGFANAQDLTPQELQAQLTQLTQEVNQLKQQQAANATAIPSKPSAPVFEIGGRIQLDYNLFNGAYNAEHNGSSAQDIFPAEYVPLLKANYRIGITSYCLNLLRIPLKSSWLGCVIRVLRMA